MLIKIWIKHSSIRHGPGGVLAALVLMLMCTPAFSAPAADEPYRVLVLHSFRNSLPVNTDWYNGIVRGFSSETDRQVEIDIEAPNLTRFGDADYVSNLLDIYRHKYRDQQPQLIIPTYTPAYRFRSTMVKSCSPVYPLFSAGPTAALLRLGNGRRILPA